MAYRQGDTAHGFDVERVENIPELEGTAVIMRHRASGARLMLIETDDVNKAFSIAFKTPPADDTGVFHILEHSVLNGSERFRVKEPFVNLIKNSMQTFLNAMTFADKTMFPVASTNERDLMNLADVYMDAVLHPAVYERPETFQQEGWHVELAEGEGPEGGDGLMYNGVVYNEMKGALAEPDEIVADALAAALFPDTAYRFESGGTPAAIPDLTYEAFLDTHARHYRLDNAYIVLYGDLDADAFLGFLDERYLRPDADLRRDAGSPNPLELQPPVKSFGNVVEMRTAPENAGMALGYVAGTVRDRLKIYAVDILLDAVASTNEAPLKRALLDAKVADDIQVYFNDDVLQPYVVVQAKGLADGAGERLRPALEAEVERLASGGLDRKLVEAELEHSEFVLRERNFGIADGVAEAVAAMEGWLYGDDLATAYVRYEDAYGELRSLIGEGYFEQLLREVFLENGHVADVRLVPVEKEAPSASDLRLAERAASMGGAERAEVERVTERLREVQSRPDSPEDLEALPHLGIADLGEAPREVRPSLEETPWGPVLRHHVPTCGITYATRYYDISGLAFEDLPYAALACLLVGSLDTAWHTAAELSLLAKSKIGNLALATKTLESKDSADQCWPKIAVEGSALAANTSHLAKMANEICLSTRFDDAERIRDIVTQKKLAMELEFANSGHKHAAARAQSKISRAAAIRQNFGGIGFYRFLCDLLDGFDEKAGALADKLSALCSAIFGGADCVVSFTGSDEDLEQYLRVFEHSRARLLRDAPLAEPAPMPGLEVALVDPAPEAFAVPTDVSFSAVALDQHAFREFPHHGSWLLASRMITYDFLWNEVRVKGGAYGVSFTMPRTSLARFASFRDPRLDDTYRRFEQAGDWLEAADPSELEWEGYVVSTVAGMDAPLKARDLIARQDTQFLSGIDPDLRAATRAQVVSARPEDVRALAPLVRAVARDGRRVVFGSREAIEASSLRWTVDTPAGRAPDDPA